MFQSIVTLRRWLAGLTLLCLAACQPEQFAPAIQPPEPPPQVKGYSIRVDLDLVDGTVTVAEPDRPANHAPRGPAFSLIGSEVLGVTAANMSRSAIGAAVANKRTVSFDLSIRNKLSVTDLVTPTFPLLPAGTRGILAFPYTVAAFGVQGGKALADTSWSGNGTTGSGSPINFFNDLDDCTTSVNSDCYRWLVFPSPLAPNQSTPVHRVGFTVDKNVTSVSIYLVVAADLADHPPVVEPGMGALTGRVFFQGNPATGAVVTVTPTGRTATVDALGKYALTALPVGSYAVHLAGLPTGCPNPSDGAAAIVSGGIATLNFNVDCPDAVGTITGTANSAQLGALTGKLVSLDREDGTGVNSELTDDAGHFTFPNVPAGNYVVTILGLPSTCHDSDEFKTVSVAAGDTTHTAFTVACPGSSPSDAISGLVTSNDQPLDGATVILVVGYDRFTTTSNGAGFYHFGPEVLPGGSGDVPIVIGVSGGLPDQCFIPAPSALTVVPGVLKDVPLGVPCGSPGNSTQVTGSVLSPSLGGLAGVHIGISVGYFPYIEAITGADGHFSYPAFNWTGPAGELTVTVLTGLPNGCTFPGSQFPLIASGRAVSVQFSAECPAATLGTITGTVTGFGPLPPVIPVVATPVPDGTPIITEIGAAGAFVLQVPDGHYLISLPTLPDGCTGSASRSAEVQNGAAVSVAFDIQCPASIFGRIHTTTGIGLDGLSVRTDDLFAAEILTTESRFGGYFSFDGTSLPVGSQVSIVVVQSGLPPGCPPAPEPRNPWGLPTNPDPSGSLHFDIAVDCTGGVAVARGGR